jgi:hypothetical protein
MGSSHSTGPGDAGFAKKNPYPVSFFYSRRNIDYLEQ